MGIAALMTGITTGAMAQETEKPGFFRQAFRDMKESARMQRDIDRANFRAVRLETRAFYQEQEYQQKMAQAKARQEAAQKRIDEARNN